jgi:hypothetical protein
MLHSYNLQVQLAHTEEQIQCCSEAVNNEQLSEQDRWGALLGLADWLDNRNRILEEIRAADVDARDAV